MLGAIVHPYVQEVPGPQVDGLRQLLHESTRQPLGLSTGSVAVLQELCHETIGGSWDAVITPCCCAALAVLWLALAPEKFPLQADTFSRAAGTAGKQKWSLILPSSARVSELTYVTIIGTRYPELDTLQNDVIQFGNYLQGDQCTRGGFLPIFWDAPYSYISTDIGEVVDWIKSKFLVAKEGDLAVLHNRNKMVNAFASTEWVAGSGGAVISRSVGLPCIAGTNQSGDSQWETREKLPSAHPTGTGSPKRRGFCKGDSGPYSCTADLPHYGPTGYAWLGRGSDHHGLSEIWCLLHCA